MKYFLNKRSKVILECMIYKWIKYLSDWDENSIDISHYYKYMIESKNEESKSIIMKMNIFIRTEIKIKVMEYRYLLFKTGFN